MDIRADRPPRSVTMFGSSTFGQPQQTSSLFAGFGQPTQPQLTQQQQPQPALQITTLNDLLSPKIFNDERDQIIGKLNHLQAFWGTGKAIYSADGTNPQLIELNPLQSAHLFKSVAYSEYKLDDTGGDRVGFLVKMQDEMSLRTAILAYENNLKQMFGNFVAKVESTKLLPANRALLTVSVTDPTTNKKVNAQQLLQHVSSPQVKNQLAAAFQQNFIEIVPFNSVAKHELQEYLSSPPSGISAQLWSQAKKENPDPSKLIPVPLIGFAALNERFKMQEQEVNQQKQRLKVIAEDVSQLERAVEATKAKLEECRKRNVPLRNKVLKAMIYQEVMKKRGYPIQPDEEKMRAKLEIMQGELNAPTKFKGCLNELMCRVRQMQSQRSVAMFNLEESALAELKAHLKQEQQGIAHLLAIVKDDMAILNKIKGGNE